MISQNLRPKHICLYKNFNDAIHSCMGNILQTYKLKKLQIFKSLNFFVKLLRSMFLFTYFLKHLLKKAQTYFMNYKCLRELL